MVSTRVDPRCIISKVVHGPLSKVITGATDVALAADASTVDVAGSDFFVSLPPQETKGKGWLLLRLLKINFFIVKINSIRFQN